MPSPLARFSAAVLAAGAVLLVPPRLDGQDTKDTARLLVDAEWLAEHLEDENLVLIQVGPAEDYLEGHIPGAVPLSLEGISRPHDHQDTTKLMLELPEDQALQQLFRQLGINDDSRIVVYWSSEWVTPTSRVMLTLDYAGLGSRSSLLDGGLEAWTAAGLALTQESSDPVPGSVTIETRDDLIVTADWVQEHAGTEGYALVDARSAAHYDGVRDSEAGNGHIPGAVNIDWRSLLDGEPAMWRDREQLAEIFAAAGVQPGDTVVGYCHIGQYATAMLFAARTLGYQVKLYDGSMQDWGSIKELPLETNEAAEGGKNGAGK